MCAKYSECKSTKKLSHLQAKDKKSFKKMRFDLELRDFFRIFAVEIIQTHHDDPH